MKITSDIFQVGGGHLTSPEDAAVYLIRFAGRAALVDAGCGNQTEKILANLEKFRVPLDSIEYLLLTHCHFDHTGGAKALQDASGCKIVAHELDAVFLEEGNAEVTAASWYGQGLEPFAVDRKLTAEREAIELGGKEIEAIHVPGHSPGSVVYLTESEGSRVLFAQDVHGPLHPSLLSDRVAYLRSLELLLSLQADILCEGHFGVYRGKEVVSKFIRRFITSG
jgi:glyoxylase-like metal-dependent hydrolase (beta-lactamase superfamily II)